MFEFGPEKATIAKSLGHILSSELFPSLYKTASYLSMLQKAGVKEPLKQNPTGPFPKSFREAWEEYAWHRLDSMEKKKDMEAPWVPGTIRAEVLTGYQKLFRISGELASRSSQRSLVEHGEWWFEETILQDCETRCRALMALKMKNPLLTEMTEDRCLRTIFRSKLAISIDWNKMRDIVGMVLHKSDRLPVLTGIGRPMTYISKSGRDPLSTATVKRKHPDAILQVANQKLAGGVRQIWVPFTPNRAAQSMGFPGSRITG